jgi:hypothetical protein
MSKRVSLFGIFAVLGVAFSVIGIPSFWIHLFMFVDYLFPYLALNESTFMIWYHTTLIDLLPIKSEIPLPELPIGVPLTTALLYTYSKGFTFPVVLRNVLNDTLARNAWSDISWWVDQFGEEKVECMYTGSAGTSQYMLKDCLGHGTDPKMRRYIKGEKDIFVRRPDLFAMVHSDLLDATIPGQYVLSQLFAGYPGTGTEIHCAMGVNAFKMLAGTKKWWLLPPSQTPYLRPTLDANGFSSRSKERVGIHNGTATPSIQKLTRYTVTLRPGDVLINPPWFWHAVENTLSGDQEGLIVGVPTRYLVDSAWPAIKNDWFLTFNSFLVARTQLEGGSLMNIGEKSRVKYVEPAQN